jgi:chromosome partitioning protein
MSHVVAIGNRQGGVGKSTLTMMLAHAIATREQVRTLVIDLDSQCNSSFALIGSEETQKTHNDGKTLSHYMSARLRGQDMSVDRIVRENAGDVGAEGASGTGVDLIVSSIDLDEDIADAISMTSLSDPFNAMNFHFRQMLIGLNAREYKYILLDCPPGLSPLVNAAIHLSNRVIIPFRPDYISQFALDRMAMKVERCGRDRTYGHTQLNPSLFLGSQHVWQHSSRAPYS